MAQAQAVCPVFRALSRAHFCASGACGAPPLQERNCAHVASGKTTYHPAAQGKKRLGVVRWQHEKIAPDPIRTVGQQGDFQMKLVIVFNDQPLEQVGDTFPRLVVLIERPAVFNIAALEYHQ